MLTAGIKGFARRLQDQELDGDITNFYNAKRTNLQRSNLQRYLAFMNEKGTDVLLVGEAPGYNGCRLTGVPFTSEYIIKEGACKGELFGIKNGYKASEKRVKKEQSAAAMWSVLEEMEVLPLLWNAFPFHPYKKGQPDSNRKPTAKELEIGKDYLFELIELFDIKKVIAVGNVAEHILSRMEIAHLKVRHPSYGGKKEFKEQLRYNLKKENL